MKKVKMLLVLGGLIVFSLLPALGVQATPSLSSGYQDKVVFHTPSHIAKWNKSTLKGLDPHVLVAFIGLMLLIIPGTFLYRVRKNQPKGKENEVNVDVANEGIKKQIILNKIRQLEEQFSQGKINQERYTETLTSYKSLLKKMEEERG
ncbi:hypothetical protein [Desulfosporosinus metallidurans]|uniref:Uncharacterized protein n=1 Tax=Desulfosporosinus metallidurans TaxID=1888891 RepID=A0A1Q8QGR8_9FIRM|nr:hypothetical protein [Desulfosporosinus metallidurans]OLN26534.1 hypothetical protein DSOL_4959 [Desulfosporosinus metallidurans]